MPRSLTLTALALAAATATLPAQNRTLGFGRADWCDTFGDNRRASHCEIQEATVASASSFDVDANANGGIAVRGWDRQDAHVRARISAVADSDARARQIVAGVRLTTDGGRIRAEGPSLGDNEHWSVSFELQVPRDARMNLEARNGGIAIENFQGTATFRTVNGGIAVTDVSGDMRGETTNGGVSVDLSGSGWVGTGLDLETRNGGIRMRIPDGYSAELETGTVNGGLRIDFPITVQGNLRNATRRITTRLGAGGAPIRAVTTNGGVSITRR